MASIATDTTDTTSNQAAPQSVRNLSKYFRDLDAIREELSEALEGWKTPVVLVFGAESAGKSTILERIAMLPMFPKGENICTRLPILVSLRQAEESQNPVLAVVKTSDDTDQGEQEIEDAEGVREKMLDVIRRQNSNVAGISKEYYLRLEIAGPEYPDLDLLDLPGLVVNPGEDEPETMEKDTHELLDMWIQRTKGRATYLAIREAADKWRTSQVHKVLTRYPFMLENTLGVLTKCDDVRNSKIMNALTDQDDKLSATRRPRRQETCSEHDVPSKIYGNTCIHEFFFHVRRCTFISRVRSSHAAIVCLLDSFSYSYYSHSYTRET